MAATNQKKLKKETLMVLFVSFIMISSIIGFMWNGGSPKTKYNGFTLVQNGNMWSINVNGAESLFFYHPLEVESINAGAESISRLKATLQIDSAYDLDDISKEEIALSQHELKQSLESSFNIYLRPGFTSKNPYDLPIISCNTSTNFVPVLYFKTSNKTEVHIEGNCVIAEAQDGGDFKMVKERILYGMMGVIG